MISRRPAASRLLDDWGRRLRASRWRLGSETAGLPNPESRIPSPESRVPGPDAIFLALGHTIRACSLPVALFEDLLSAFRQDVVTTRYATWADVMDYCRRSANPVGRLVLRVAGHADAGLDRASDAVCTALQLTNFWQDLERDWRKGRLYVPRDERERFGAREADLDARVMSAAWREALSEMAARTRRAVRRRPRRLRRPGRTPSVRVATHLARRDARILDRLERAGFDVFRARPTLGSSDIPALLWGAVAWGRPRAGLSIAMARRNTNFYYSFVVLPEHKRHAIIAVWDFCRAVDDDVDERAGQLGTEESRREAAASMAGWRDELAACYEGRQPRTPQGMALAPHIAAFKLPRQPLEDVIDGVEMDLDRPRFRTFDELRGYCLRVASAVGLVCIEIFGYHESPVPAVRDRSRHRAPVDQHPSRSRARPGRRASVSAD